MVKEARDRIDPDHSSGGQSGSISTDGDRAEVLRRLIALYRHYLREGVDSALAETYLRELQKAETALERLKQRPHSEV